MISSHPEERSALPVFFAYFSKQLLESSETLQKLMLTSLGISHSVSDVGGTLQAFTYRKANT